MNAFTERPLTNADLPEIDRNVLLGWKAQGATVIRLRRNPEWWHAFDRNHDDRGQRVRDAYYAEASVVVYDNQPGSVGRTVLEGVRGAAADLGRLAQHFNAAAIELGEVGGEGDEWTAGDLITLKTCGMDVPVYRAGWIG